MVDTYGPATLTRFEGFEIGDTIEAGDLRLEVVCASGHDILHVAFSGARTAAGSLRGMCCWPCPRRSLGRWRMTSTPTSPRSIASRRSRPPSTSCSPATAPTCKVRRGDRARARAIATIRPSLRGDHPLGAGSLADPTRPVGDRAGRLSHRRPALAGVALVGPRPRCWTTHLARHHRARPCITCIETPDGPLYQAIKGELELTSPLRKRRGFLESPPRVPASSTAALHRTHPMSSLLPSHSGVVPAPDGWPVPDSPSVRHRSRTGQRAVLGSRSGSGCLGRLVLAALDPFNATHARSAFQDER